MGLYVQSGSHNHTSRRRGRRPAEGEPLLDRAFRMLVCFDPDNRTLSLTSLALRADIPKSSALRIARKLVEWGALERLPSGDYAVGLRLLEIASLAPRGHGLRATALPYMQDLHHATGQHVQLAVQEGLQAVLVERLSRWDADQGKYRVGGRMPYRVGGRMPLHSTAPGLVLLAFAPADVQEEILATHWPADEENTNGTGSELRARLAAVRRNRYAVSSRHKWGIPRTAVAAPLVDQHGDTVAAVSVLGRTEELDPAVHIPAVVAVARAISRALAADAIVPGSR